MVQKKVQKLVQAKSGGSKVGKDQAMPQYMSKSPSGTGYLFRRSVPADARSVIGKREFKFTLGGDYRAASQRCRELAVETDRQIDAARAGVTMQSNASDESKRVIAQSLPQFAAITAVTPDLVAWLRATVAEQVERADREQRYSAREAINPNQKLQQIEGIRRWAKLAQFGDETAAYGWRDMLDGTLRRNGYHIADELRDSLQERSLLVEYATAHDEALEVIEARYSGKPMPLRLPTPSLGRAEPRFGPGAMRLSTAISEFLKHLPSAQRAMNEKHGFILPAFLEVVGDMPITDLRQSHVNDFLVTVQKLPPDWSDLRRNDGQSIRKLANQEWPKTLAAKTYEGSYLASLRKFLQRAVADWQDVGFPTTLTTDVPYQGSRTKTEHKQRALRPSEITEIFFNERMKKIVSSPAKVHKFWLLAMELYTGARVREICQINPQYDYGCEDDTWWLKLTNELGDSPDPDVVKSVKTGRPRTIPMHPELFRLGLPHYLAQLKQGGARRLYPQWAPNDGDAGAGPGKFVANYMRAIGLHGVANEQGNAVRGSHTFRHTLLTYGRKLGVNLRCISGHKESSDNKVADGYEDETVLLPLVEKAARLAQLTYGIELPVPVPALVASRAG
jgi:integrase